MDIIVNCFRRLTKSKSNNNAPAEIFKLKMDHFEEIFNWLLLRDVFAFGQTCQRMKHVVGYYIKTSGSAIEFHSRSDGIYARLIPSMERENYDKIEVKADAFSSYVKKLEFHYLEDIEYDRERRTCKEPTKIVAHMEADLLKSLTEIQLAFVVLTTEGISRIKEILGQVETVKLEYPQFRYENQEFYECFLQFCIKVKKLCVHGALNLPGAPIVGIDNSWLLLKYPTLEWLELTTLKTGPIDELRTCFDQNTGIKTFATNIELILANIETFHNTIAKWDVLSIHFEEAKKLNSSWSLLNNLHERGLFRELHLHFSGRDFKQETVNELTSVNGFVRLYIQMGLSYISADLSPLTNLKQLSIYFAFSPDMMESLAKNLVNLELLLLTDGRFSHIQPFICYSQKLKTIILLNDLNNESSKSILKIEELNEERSKLINAQKLRIYVEEHVYLTAKWVASKTNWSFIEIRRFESYDALHHNFDWFYQQMP